MTQNKKTSVALLPGIVCLMIVSACGQSSDAGTLGTGSTSGSGTNPFSSATNSSFKVKEGTYSYSFSQMNYKCSDGSIGISQGVALQMAVTVSGSMLYFVQTAASGTASQEKATAVGTRVISSTTPSGPVDSKGEFFATSTALLDDPSLGYMRVSYKWEGKFTDSGWSGEHTSSVYFEDMLVTCTYTATFRGFYSPT
ncbi:MAG: hypothetical protein RIR26_1092 [Pseudomonadota bacterium]|jgi:hypothetical protein